MGYQEFHPPYGNSARVQHSESSDSGREKVPLNILNLCDNETIRRDSTTEIKTPEMLDRPRSQTFDKKRTAPNINHLTNIEDKRKKQPRKSFTIELPQNAKGKRKKSRSPQSNYLTLKKKSSRGKEKEILDQIKALKPTRLSDRSGKSGKDKKPSWQRSQIVGLEGSDNKDQNSDQRSGNYLSMKQEYKKMQSNSSKSIQSSMLNKFIKSFRSKYNLAEFPKSHSQIVVSDHDILGDRGTSKHLESSQSLASSSNVQPSSHHPSAQAIFKE